MIREKLYHVDGCLSNVQFSLEELYIVSHLKQGYS